MTSSRPDIPPLLAPEFRTVLSPEFSVDVTQRIRMVSPSGRELRWVHRAKGPKFEGSREAIRMAEFAVTFEIRVAIHPEVPGPVVASTDSELGVLAAMYWALGDRSQLAEVTPSLWNILHGSDDNLEDGSDGENGRDGLEVEDENEDQGTAGDTPTLFPEVVELPTEPQ